MKKAVYAGSFDPMTNGHVWILEQASKLFDELIVAVGENYSKSYTFPLNDRLRLIEEVVKGASNIKVANFSNQFLVNYAKKIAANYIVRGIRNSQDYEYEKTMRHVNFDLNRDITTIFLLPPRQFAEVSSSMVKGLIGSSGWEEVVGQYVPSSVLEFLRHQYALNNSSK